MKGVWYRGWITNCPTRESRGSTLEKEFISCMNLSKGFSFISFWTPKRDRKRIAASSHLFRQTQTGDMRCCMVPLLFTVLLAFIIDVSNLFSFIVLLWHWAELSFTGTRGTSEFSGASAQISIALKQILYYFVNAFQIWYSRPAWRIKFDNKIV